MANKVLSAIEGLMRGVCNQPQAREVVRVVQQEFDYDKLAEAIVKATEESKKKELEKKDSPATVLSSFAAGMFVLLGIVMVFAVIVITFASVELYKGASWGTLQDIITNIFVALLILFLLFTAGGMCVCSFKAAGEVSAEKDRHYTVAVASALISLVALIVALIALVKKIE